MGARALIKVGRWTLTAGTLALVTLASRPADAAALPSGVTYSTAARLSGVGLPVSFEGVQDETVPDAGPIRLGRFVVKTPETGGDVTFDDAAFAVEFNAPKYHSVEPATDPTSVLSKVEFNGVFTVEGRLNGVVFADGTSTLKATLDGVKAVGLTQNSLDTTYVDALPFSVSDVSVVPELDLTSGAGGLDGVELSAQLVDSSLAATATPLLATAVQPVPEPSSVAVFLAGLCGLAAYRRRQNS